MNTIDLFDGICENCNNAEYCTLKELFVVCKLMNNRRLLVQLKCIEIFKYEESELELRDIGWHQATLDWGDKFAKTFDTVYSAAKIDDELHIDPVNVYKEIRRIVDEEE